MIRRRDFLKNCAATAAGLSFAQNLFASKKKLFAAKTLNIGLDADRNSRPNILYFMSDDHASNAISCYNSWLKDFAKTPNIDKIAAQGMRFNNCLCNNSICTPSRASIITGQYSHLNGVKKLGKSMKSDHPSFVRQLTEAGYQTALIGKWHIDSKPAEFSFYQALGRPGSWGQGKYFNPTFDKNGVKTSYTGYVSDVIGNLTIDWLENRDKTKPFMMMCQHKAPHGLWEYAPRHENMFKNQDIIEPPTLFDDFSNRAPDQISRHWAHILGLAGRMSKSSWPTGQLNISGMNDTQKIKAAYQKYIKDYIRCITAVDENVGRVLDYLDDNDLTQNTIVIYTSDQGMFLGEHGFYDKRMFLEDSLKMPFLIRYPGQIQPGTICDDLVMNIDFGPTLLDYAGLDTPTQMQGKSFKPFLEGKTPPSWRDCSFYAYWQGRPRHHGIRTDRYKLICYRYTSKPNIYDLFDLQTDPLELVSLYDNPQYASIKNMMMQKLTAKMTEIKITQSQLPKND